MRQGTGPSASVESGHVRGSVPGSNSQELPLGAHGQGCAHRKLLAVCFRAVASIEMTFDQITCRRDLETLMSDLEVGAVRIFEHKQSQNDVRSFSVCTDSSVTRVTPSRPTALMSGTYEFSGISSLREACHEL
jgi:hypothetical protein